MRDDADTVDDGVIAFDDVLVAPREPDTVQWTRDGNLARERRPELLQVLPVGDAPEGLLTLEKRGLFVASNEDDGSLSVFGLARR